MIKVLIFISMLFIGVIHAQEDTIPQVVLDAIKDTECLKVKGVNYPFFIRVNRDEDVEKAKNLKMKISRRIIKCKSADGCSDKVEELLRVGIKNIDLGPFQINYFYQHERWKKEKDYVLYFSHDSAENKAREILNDLISRHGYSWRTLGRYHHFDPKNKARNRNYYSKLYEYIYGEAPLISKL